MFQVIYGVYLIKCFLIIALLLRGNVNLTSDFQKFILLETGREITGVMLSPEPFINLSHACIVRYAFYMCQAG